MKSASDKTEIVSEGDRTVISTPYNPEFVKKIREIKGRRWDPRRRVWTVPRASEHTARKLVHDYFPAEDPDAWKEEAAETIAAHVLVYLPEGFELRTKAIDEEDGSTTVSIRRSDAPELEEVNITIEDDWRLRESISEEDAEYLAKKLQERKSCWLDWTREIDTHTTGGMPASNMR